MRFLRTIAILGILAAGCTGPVRRPSSARRDPVRILQELQQMLPAVSAPRSATETLALLQAHFSDRNPELERRFLPATSGEDLYLFPDRSYLYVRWADIMPATIFDRGTWSFETEVLALQSDRSVQQQDFPKDRRFVPLYYNVSGRRTLLLMGTNWDFSYFKENATKSDDLMLLLCSFTHIEPIEPARAETLRQKLYADSWKPEFFNE